MNKSLSYPLVASQAVSVMSRKPAQAPRPDYCKPVLICYGDVRDVTLGGSALIFESGPFGPDGCKLSGQRSRSCLP